MTTYGYARVSTDGQTLAAQDAALRAAGCAKVFAEKASGASATNRAELRKALARLGEGDVLVVTRLDRLARSTRDLLNTLDEITKRGAGFKSLADTWADTTTAHGRLMLTILGGLAEFERELIRARTSEGRKRAKAAGVHMGRPSKLNRNQQREALARGGLAEFERELIRARTSEGRKRAKAAGVHMGRPSKLNRNQQREALARRDAGETLTDIARTFGVSHTTIGRLR